MHRLTLLLPVILTICSCAPGPGTPSPPPPVQVSSPVQPSSLQRYIDSLASHEVKSDLIACAAGGHIGFTTEGPAPTSVFFYPIPGAEDFRYFETASLDADSTDYSGYKQIDKEVAPVFNGYLRRFVTDYTDRDTWVVVTYVTDGVLHLSGHVRLKVTTKPTEFAPENVGIGRKNGRLTFSWSDGRTPENAIYFEVVSDLEGNLISGTYTEEKHFTFYDTGNVTHNIRDVQPPPTLQSGQSYNFTLMAVSEDNWVNMIAREEFVAP